MSYIGDRPPSEVPVYCLCFLAYAQIDPCPHTLDLPFTSHNSSVGYCCCSQTHRRAARVNNSEHMTCWQARTCSLDLISFIQCKFIQIGNIFGKIETSLAICDGPWRHCCTLFAVLPTSSTYSCLRRALHFEILEVSLKGRYEKTEVICRKEVEICDVSSCRIREIVLAIEPKLLRNELSSSVLLFGPSNKPRNCTSALPQQLSASATILSISQVTSFLSFCILARQPALSLLIVSTSSANSCWDSRSILLGNYGRIDISRS